MLQGRSEGYWQSCVGTGTVMCRAVDEPGDTLRKPAQEMGPRTCI